MHDITGNRFTPKQSYGRHINSKSVAVVTTITAAAALLTTKQDGNRRGAEAHYKNLKLRAWGKKKREKKHYLKQLLKKSGAWNMLHGPQTSYRSRINVES